MWFTENPWPPIVICAVAGVLCFLRWAATRRGAYLVAVAAIVGVQFAIYFVEQSIVTEAEEIEAAVQDLTDAVVAGDTERSLSYISEEAPIVRGLVTAAMERYEVREDLRITDLSVEMFAANSQGRSHFRANGTVVRRGAGVAGRGATRWVLTWRREEGRWRIIAVKRLDPINGEEIGFLDH